MGKQDNNGQCAVIYETVSCDVKYDPAVSISQIRASEKLEIALVTEGSGVHQILNQAIPCKAGDIYVVPAHIPHGFFCGDESGELKYRRLTFEAKELLDGEVATHGEPRFCYGIFRDSAVVAYAMLNLSTREKLEALLDLIDEELERKGPEWFDAVRSHVCIILITLGRYVNSAIQNLPSFPKKELHLVYSTVRAVTEGYVDSDLTLERIAGTLFVSKSHLSRVFKRVIGEQFSDYLRKVRIGHVCRMLQNTELPSTEIAAKCGFKDIPSFYRNFQASCGKTPSQYRKTRQNYKDAECNSLVNVLREIPECIEAGSVTRLKELIGRAISDNAKASDIVDHMLVGMNAVGEKFKNNEVYVPEVLVAARAMNAGMQLLKPILASEGTRTVGRACLGTVRGDLHDIGKNLVKIMLEGKGIEVIDLGTDVEPELFVNTAKEQNCDLICCSALLTTTMSVIKEVVTLSEEAGIRDKVKIMIGGAPISEVFCQEVGADVYTSDAASCADKAYEICSKIKR